MMRKYKLHTPSLPFSLAVLSSLIIVGNNVVEGIAANKQGGGRFQAESSKPKKSKTRKKRTKTIKKKAPAPSNLFASASNAIGCRNVNWRGSGFTSSPSGSLTITANKACWINYINGVGSSNRFIGGSIRHSGPNVVVTQASKNKVLFRPKMGYRGQETATLIVNMQKNGVPYTYTINYRINIR